MCRFGITGKADSSKPSGTAGQKKTAAGAAAGGAAAAPKTLEEQIKIIERGIKYGTASESDQQKLEKLKKQLEAQHEKQRLALDKVGWLYGC